MGREDYCFLPTNEAGTVNYVGECSSSTYLCGECEGDCDDDSDCEGDLICQSRDALETVSGCSGEGGSRDMFGKDICVTPPSGGNEINNVGNPCTDTFGTDQCEVCTGDCDNDDDCAGAMRCAQRGRSDGLENVPGEFLKYHSSSIKDCISFKVSQTFFFLRMCMACQL